MVRQKEEHYETDKKYTTITKGKNVPVEISKTSRSIKSANAELSDAYFFIWVDEDGNEFQVYRDDYFSNPLFER